MHAKRLREPASLLFKIRILACKAGGRSGQDPVQSLDVTSPNTPRPRGKALRILLGQSGLGGLLAGLAAASTLILGLFGFRLQSPSDAKASPSPSGAASPSASPAQAAILDPTPGTTTPTCLVKVRFTGSVAENARFVLSTVQANSRHYFEADVRHDQTAGQWVGEVQTGFKDRGLGERYEIEVYALDRELAAYLATMKQDDDPTNTWWTSRELPPGVTGPIAATFITRSKDPDPECRS